MRIATRSLALGAAAIVLAACGGSVPSSAAATVNGAEIPRAQVEDAIDELAEQLDEVPDDQRDEAIEGQQREILTLLIQDAVIAEMVSDQGIEIDEGDEADAREQMVASAGGEETLPQALAQAGLTQGIFDDVIVPQQARLVALANELTQDETLETRTVRHILVESQEEGDDVVERLDAGEDFAEVAQEVSTDTGSAEQGGELPPSPRGVFVPEFDEATWDAELNEVVGPVESQFGFHVLEVLEEDVTEGPDLDPQQVQELAGPQLQELIMTALGEAVVEVDESFGEWDPDQQRVVAVGQVGEAPEAPMDPGGVPPGGPEGELTPEQLEELQRELEGLEDLAPEDLENPDGGTDDAPSDDPEESDES